MAVLLPESPLRPDRDEVSTSDKTLLHSLYLVTLLRSVILSYGGSLIALALCVPALMFGAVARHTDWGVTRYGQCHGAPDASAAKFVLPLCLKHLTPPAVSWIGVGVISAAVMSSADSSLLSSSALIARNIWAKLVR